MDCTQTNNNWFRVCTYLVKAPLFGTILPSGEGSNPEVCVRDGCWRRISTTPAQKRRRHGGVVSYEASNVAQTVELDIRQVPFREKIAKNVEVPLIAAAFPYSVKDLRCRLVSRFCVIIHFGSADVQVHSAEPSVRQ